MATPTRAAQAWLFGIARNLVRRYRRRGHAELRACRRLGVDVDHHDNFTQADERADAAARRSELDAALHELPDTQRQALELRIVDELGYDEAATRMGTSEQNARIRVSRALKSRTRRRRLTSARACGAGG